MSLNLNRLFVAGRLSRDPEIRYSQKGRLIAEIGLAVDREWIDDADQKKQDSTFLDITCFGRIAEIAREYLHKGDPALFEARLHQDRWQDNQGNQCQKLGIIAIRVQLLGRKPQGQGAGAAGGGIAPHRKEDLDYEPDDIPFRSTIGRDVRRSRLSRRRML